MESEKSRICKKCLLRDNIGDEDYKESIEKYINIIAARDRTTAEEYERRLSICKECDNLLSGTCLSCGCYVEIRAALKTNRCPRRKW